MLRALIPGLAVFVACSYPSLERLCTPDDPPGTACAFPDNGSDCPSLHAAPQPTTPSIQLLVDRSGSMVEMIGSVTRYAAMTAALVGPQGVATQLQQQAYFGATIFSDEMPCPRLVTAPRVLNNASAIAGLISAQAPLGATPTAAAIDAVVADFAATPPPAGSPPIVVLATDGLPNACGNPNMTTEPLSIAAATRAYAAGIRMFVLSVDDTGVTAAHFQALANAGQGVQAGAPNAAYYPVTSPAQLTEALQTVIGGLIVSCDLKLSAAVDTPAVERGQVTLDGKVLIRGVDWALDGDRTTIHILGTTCSMLRAASAPVVEAMFPCIAK